MCCFWCEKIEDVFEGGGYGGGAAERTGFEFY